MIANRIRNGDLRFGSSVVAQPAANAPFLRGDSQRFSARGKARTLHSVAPRMALYLDASLRRTAASEVAVKRTYIRSREFDTTLLAAPIVAGLVAALIVTADARLYPILLVADLWLLGYHHVVATYTRLAFDTQSLRRNRFLAVDLLGIVTVVTLGVALTAGAWVIATAFMYLQWFHYMRQGYGIARMYYRATPEGQVPGSRDLFADLAIYLVPIYGIAARSASMGDRFLGLPVKALVLPDPILILLGCAAAAAVIAWMAKSMRAVLADTLDLQYTGFVASHIVIFLVAVRRDRGCQHRLAGDQRLAQLPVRAGRVDVEREALCRRNRSDGAIPLAPQPARSRDDVLRVLPGHHDADLCSDRSRYGAGPRRRHGRDDRHLHGHQLPPLHRRCPDLETPEDP